jgi:hypothetical protein
MSEAGSRYLTTCIPKLYNLCCTIMQYVQPTKMARVQMSSFRMNFAFLGLQLHNLVQCVT